MHSIGGSTVGSTSPERKSKLPRLNAGANGGAQRPDVERRRFMTVVRPFSVFPEPALPPNFAIVANKVPDSWGTSGSQITRGRPPSPAPFARANVARPGRPTQFTINGQGAFNRSLSEDRAAAKNAAAAGVVAAGRIPGSALMRLNLAGGSGWDLTAIRRSYKYVLFDQSHFFLLGNKEIKYK